LFLLFWFLLLSSFWRIKTHHNSTCVLLLSCLPLLPLFFFNAHYLIVRICNHFHNVSHLIVLLSLCLHISLSGNLLLLLHLLYLPFFFCIPPPLLSQQSLRLLPLIFPLPLLVSLFLPPPSFLVLFLLPLSFLNLSRPFFLKFNPLLLFLPQLFLRVIISLLLFLHPFLFLELLLVLLSLLLLPLLLFLLPLLVLDCLLVLLFLLLLLLLLLVMIVWLLGCPSHTVLRRLHLLLLLWAVRLRVRGSRLLLVSSESSCHARRD